MSARKLASQSARATNERFDYAAGWLLDQTDRDTQKLFWAFVNGEITADELDTFGPRELAERKAELGIED
jgi:hypothetical protein